MVDGYLELASPGARARPFGASLTPTSLAAESGDLQLFSRSFIGDTLFLANAAGFLLHKSNKWMQINSTQQPAAERGGVDQPMSPSHETSTMQEMPAVFAPQTKSAKSDRIIGVTYAE